MIPYLAYSFWEGDNLSWFHCYTLVSLHKYNPDIKIILYTSSGGANIKWGSGEHGVEVENKVDFNIIKKFPYIETISIDFNDYELSNSLSPVYKADFVRIIKGKEHGGVWFDMDILFIAPIPRDFFNCECDIVRYKYTYHVYEFATKTISLADSTIVPTGLLAISPNCKTINKLATELYSIMKAPLEAYQTIGPELWKNVVGEQTENIIIKDGKEIYPFLWTQLDGLFNKTEDVCTPGTWAIHWYNGANDTKTAINNYRFDDLAEWDSVFGYYLRKMLG